MVKPFGIDENEILQNIDNAKYIITSKFKEKLWCEEILVVKRKLRYNNEVINPNLEDQKYLLIVTSLWKKINIAKIKTNGHELHSGIGRWSISKIPCVKTGCHLCESMSLEDENHFLLEYLSYTYIRSMFHSIFHNTNLYNLLIFQNYTKLGKILGNFFEDNNQILK